jgi:WD40 repeat protein
MLHIDLETGEVLRMFAHGSRVEGVAFSRDGKAAVSAGYDGRIVRWDLEADQPVREFAGHRNGVREVSFSPDGRILASAGLDGTVRLWDFGTGQEVRVYRHHAEEVWSARFALDGRQLLSGGGTGRDFDIRVWGVPQPPDPERDE